MGTHESEAAAVVASIRSDVAKKKANKAYPDELMMRLRTELALHVDDEPLDALADVNPAKPVVNRLPGVGPVIVFVKKVIRRTVAWYVIPIVGDQNRFNRRAAAELRNVARAMADEDRAWRRRASDPPFDAKLEKGRDTILGAWGKFVAHHVKSEGSDVGIVGANGDAVEGALAKLQGYIRRDGNPCQTLQAWREESLDLLVAFGITRYLQPNVLLSFVDVAMERLRPGGTLLLDAAVPTHDTLPSAMDPLMQRWMGPDAVHTLLVNRGVEISVVELGKQDGVRWSGVAVTRLGR